jgi:PAS domain S-box-containing protein
MAAFRGAARMTIASALRTIDAPDMEDLVPGFREIAKNALLIAAGVYAVFALMHATLLPADIRVAMALTAAITAVLLACLYAAFRARLMLERTERRVMFAIIFGGWFNSALHLWLSGEPMQATNLAVVMIAAGIVLVSRAEFLATLALCWAAWTLAIVGQGAAENWLHFAINMFEGMVLGTATFLWKRLALLRNRDLRREEQRAREEVEQSLRRAHQADVAFQQALDKHREIERAAIDTLRENEERFRTICTLAPVGIALNSMEDGRFLTGSKALFEMVGYSEEEFAGLTYWDITPKDYDADEARQLEDLRRLGRYGPYEKEYIKKGGQRFPVLLNGRKFVDTSGRELILSVIQDISAQKATEAAIAAARDAAQAANVAKSRFLATMSHELRTPLNAILGFSEIIAKQTFGPAGCQQYVEYAEIINGSGAHLLSLISDILDLSKIEAGKLEMRPETIDVREVIAEALGLVGAKHASGPQPRAMIAVDLPMLTADRRALIQMIVNLVSNAVKFTAADGKVTIDARCDDEGAMTITVADTGIGIAKADIPKALAPFVQVDDGAARRQGGTGLGLPIVKSLVELHGGRFVLDSDTGQGTRATLVFPRQRVAARAA